MTEAIAVPIHPMAMAATTVGHLRDIGMVGIVRVGRFNRQGLPRGSSGRMRRKGCKSRQQSQGSGE